MHAFPHRQVHTVATKEQAGVKKAARSMRSLRKNDALTLFKEWTMDSPFDTKGGIVYSPSGQNPYTEAMDKTLKDLPTLSFRSKPNHASDGVKASKQGLHVGGTASSAHPLSLLTDDKKASLLLLLGLSSGSLP